MEEPPRIYKYLEDYNYSEKAKGMSFFAFVVFIAIYISIFYIFNLSPQIFLNNSKFWFFISNTIIIIIAADYGAFYFSKENKLTLYDEYNVLRSQTKNMASSLISQYPEIAENSMASSLISQCPEIAENNIPKDEENHRLLITEEGNSEDSERVVDIIVGTDMRDNSSKDDDGDWEEKGVIETEKNWGGDLNVVEKVEDEKECCILERSEVEENNEFSNMSDEELNRRVEEFIRSFHRQIRLQGLLEAAESTFESLES